MHGRAADLHGVGSRLALRIVGVVRVIENPIARQCRQNRPRGQGHFAKSRPEGRARLDVTFGIRADEHRRIGFSHVEGGGMARKGCARR